MHACRAKTQPAILLCAVLLAAAASGCYRPCEPESDLQLCRRFNADCGWLAKSDSCGVARRVQCGPCNTPELCGGGGRSNFCDTCSHPPVEPHCSDGWCSIPSGCFKMGSECTTPPSPCCRAVVEENTVVPDVPFAKERAHDVALTHAFEISTTEVTQRSFDLQMNYNPSKNPSAGENPVDHVSWHDAVAYANRLSEIRGLARCYDCTEKGSRLDCRVAPSYAGDRIYDCPGYRLPTEAEWEYAYRAGTTTDLYSGNLGDCSAPSAELDKIAWYAENSRNAGVAESQPVAKKQANAWGLHDMAGNVWEWTHDWAEDHLTAVAATNPAGPEAGTLKILRGGAYEWGEPMFFRASTRRTETPDHLCYSVGFRLARTK
jgi:formylglycine-generating enzyme required for sulfatase activity